MNTQTLPSKTIDLKILDQTFKVSFPTTGEFIDIQALKGKIASDNYNQLSNSKDQYTGYAMLLTDMIATYNILIPDLKEKINVINLLSLNMLESKTLLDTYIEQWLPFFEKWMNIITAAKIKDEEKITA